MTLHHVGMRSQLRPSLLPIGLAVTYGTIPILLVGLLSLFWPDCYRSIYFFFINGIGAFLGVLVLGRIFAWKEADPTPYTFRPVQLLFGVVLGIGFYALRWHVLPDTPPEGSAPYLYMLAFLLRSSAYLRVLAVAVPLALLYPVLEEIAFRGMVQTAFRRMSKGIAVPVLCTSFLFTLLHVTPCPDPWPVITVFLLAITMSILKEGTGSLLPAMALHITYNTLELVLHIPK